MQSPTIPAAVAILTCCMCVTISLFSIYVLGAEKPYYILFVVEKFFSTVIFAMLGIFVEPLLRLLVSEFRDPFQNRDEL